MYMQLKEKFIPVYRDAYAASLYEIDELGNTASKPFDYIEPEDTYEVWQVTYDEDGNEMMREFVQSCDTLKQTMRIVEEHNNIKVVDEE